MPKLQTAPPPLVAVGVLSYNRSEGLRRALNAILDQTHRNLSVFVSDDGSEDAGVFEILREFAARDARVSWVTHENLGIYRNFGCALENHPARDAEFFMWAANDDILAPEFVEECLSNLTHPLNRAVVAFTKMRVIDGRSRTLRIYHNRVGCGSDSALRRSMRYLLNNEEGAVYGLYRRRHINKIFCTNLFGADHLALFDLMRQGNIHISNRILYAKATLGNGGDRARFHQFADTVHGKTALALSSTLTWIFLFLRQIWTGPYGLRDRFVLTIGVALRFTIQPRYWRQFASDILALLIRRDIWNFQTVQKEESGRVV